MVFQTSYENINPFDFNMCCKCIMNFICWQQLLNNSFFRVDIFSKNIETSYKSKLRNSILLWTFEEKRTRPFAIIIICAAIKLRIVAKVTEQCYWVLQRYGRKVEISHGDPRTTQFREPPGTSRSLGNVLYYLNFKS